MSTGGPSRVALIGVGMVSGTYADALASMQDRVVLMGALGRRADSAAAFLAEFVKRRDRWAHLDMAGPAYGPRARPKSFGATGYGVALTTAWLSRVAASG